MPEKRFSSDSTSYPVPYGQGAEPRDSSMHSEDPSAINHYLEILLRRKWTILAFMGAIFALMGAVTLYVPWTYKAEASIEVSPTAPNVTTFAEVMGNSSPGEEYTRTEAAILTNRGLASRVIKKLNMDKNPAFNPYLAGKNAGLGHRIKELLVRLFYGKLSPSQVLLERREALIRAFERDLDAQMTLGTNIITVTFSSTDPSLAKKAANATIEEFVNWQVDRSVDAARVARAQLEKQIGSAFLRLDKSQAQLDKYAKQWGIVSLTSGSNRILQQLDTINQALEKVEANRIAKSAYYNSAQNSDLGSLPAVLQSGLIQKLEDQYTRLESRYEELRVLYRENFPVMQKLKAQIAYTGARIGVEQKRVLHSIREDYDAAARASLALEASSRKDQALAIDFNNKIQTYRTLQSQVDANRKVYVSLLRRSAEIEANEGAELGKVKVLSLASLPVVPYKPNLLLNFLIALVVGVAGGAGMAFILENSDTTLRSAREVSLCYSGRIIGVLPHVGRAGAKRLSVRVLNRPDSIFSRAIKFTRTLLELSTSIGNPARSMLITSTEANAGKSTVAANLALAFASSGREKVLLIDADFSPACRHDFFSKYGGPKPAGLTDYLDGQCALDDVLCGTELANLSFVSSGGGSDSTGRLLQSSEMRNLILELGSRYDRIIIDGQPFGPETLALARIVDGVILLAAIGGTPRKSLQIIHDNIILVGANILGVIVNKLRANRYSCDYYACYYNASSRRSRSGIDGIDQLQSC